MKLKRISTITSVFFLIFGLSVGTNFANTTLKQLSPQVKKKPKVKRIIKKITLLETRLKAYSMFGAIGDTVPVKGKLTFKKKGNPIANKLVKFYIANKFIGESQTDSSGFAKIMYKVPNKFGSKPMLIKFSGIGNLIKSSDTANFGTAKSSVKLFPSSPNSEYSVRSGKELLVCGYLRRITDNSGIEGRELEAFFNDKFHSKLTSTAQGRYCLKYNVPSNHQGPLTLKVLFKGDVLYTAGSRVDSIKVLPKRIKAYLSWNGASGTVGNTLTIKAYFSKTPSYQGSQGIAGKKIKFSVKSSDTGNNGHEEYIRLGSAYTNGSGVATLTYRVEHKAITSYMSAGLVDTNYDYDVTRNTNYAQQSYKIKRSPVKINISGPDTVRIGDTVLYTVYVNRTTDNAGVSEVMVTLGARDKKKSSHLGTAGFFYKIPMTIGVGQRELKATTTGNKFCEVGEGIKKVTVKPSNN